MASAEHEFWTSENEYHELAKQFERGVTIKPPSEKVECKFGFSAHCPFCATSVKRYRYTGPRVTNL